MVGEIARAEGREPVAAEHDTDHVRGEPLDAFDAPSVQLPRLARRTVCHADLH